MANYGYVKSKKWISANEVTELIHRLNHSHFKNRLFIESGKGGWGLHTWHVRYISDGGVQAERVFWLETNRTFCVSHGGGGFKFAWWMDFLILDRVAEMVDGVISDDGDDRKWKATGKYDTFDDFVEEECSYTGNPIFQDLIRAEAYQYAPKEFRK